MLLDVDELGIFLGNYVCKIVLGRGGKKDGSTNAHTSNFNTFLPPFRLLGYGVSFKFCGELTL